MVDDRGRLAVSLLFIAPLPKPITGQSLASQTLLDVLTAREVVIVVNLSQGAGRIGELGHSASGHERIPRVLGILWAVWRGARKATGVYFTVSQSVSGNIKDLLVYLLCFNRLSRMVIHVHGGMAMQKLLTNKFLRVPNRFFLKRIGAAVVLGKRQLEVFDGLVPKDRIHIVQNFAIGSLFLDPDAVKEKFRKTNPIRLLFLSNLLVGKGHIELVEAFKGLSSDIRERFHLDIAGGFYANDDKVAFANSIAGISQISYHGVVDGAEKQALFREAHVYCLPTYYRFEGQPISLLEAYASGCVVLTTDHSGIFDVFTPGQNGFCVEKRSSISIQRVLESLVEKPDELMAMAANNRSAADAYRAEKFTERLALIIGQLEST